MKFLHLTAFIGIVFLSACASHPRVVVVHEPDPEQPPRHIPLQSEANVIIPGQTKAYPVARYVDPSNPRIMHERHVIYRREEDDRWRLASNARQQILIGNLESDSRQERRTAPYAQELPNLLRKNQEEAQALNQTIEEQNKQTAAVVSSIRNLGDGMQALNRRLGVVERNSTVQDKVARLRNQRSLRVINLRHKGPRLQIRAQQTSIRMEHSSNRKRAG